MQNRFFPYINTGVFVIGIMLLAFWIRVQGTEHLPTGQFTEHDAYLYAWQAGIITEQRHLPERDMHRWLPIGRDNTQLLSLYPYAIAYLHKVFPWWSLYQIQCYLPPLCFAIGLGGLLLFLTHCYSIRFAAIVGILLATLPGSIERSAVGFGDRDAWSWMFGTLAVTSYLWKEQLRPGWHRYLATALAGFIVFLGGLSWEGFGFFLLIIHAAELWKFCTTETEQHLKAYLLWMLMFVPGLFVISPVYRNGYGFSTHVAALMLTPPLVIFTLRGVRYLLLRFYQPLRLYPHQLAWGLTLIAMSAGIGYFLLQADTFETTAFAFRESRLMRTIGELVDPPFSYWHQRYGVVFISGSFGLIITSFQLWKRSALPLIGSLLLFVGTTFFRDVVSGWTNASICNTLFIISLGSTLLSLGSLAYLRREAAAGEIITLAILTWFLLWVGLARGGKRYDFFIGVPVAYFTATFIQFIADTLCDDVKQIGQLNLRKTGIACVMLAVFLFFPPFGGFVQRSLFAATQMRQAVPGTGSVREAFHWIKARLPNTAIVAANWGYGSQLNVLAGVKTITDQDQYIPHWIHLYNRHVCRTSTEREALEFLKTHGATHLMLTISDLATAPFATGESKKSFLPVYPEENFSNARVKIWEIRYPPDIKPNPKYLETEPEGTSEK